MREAMARVELATHIAAMPATCFDLARDLDLHLDSLRDTGERAVAGRMSGLIDLGEQVTWRARHAGIVFQLTVRITAFDRPHHFRDSIVAGPFRAFEHDHRFSEVPDGTIMRDVIAFRAPFGLLGRIAEVAFLRHHLARVLGKRAEAIKARAEHGDSNTAAVASREAL